MKKQIALVAVLGLLGSACVTQETYNAKVSELEKLRQMQESQWGQKLTTCEGMYQQKSNALNECQVGVADLEDRLKKLGQNVDQLSTERKNLLQGLDQARANVEELRKQKAAADARAATFKNLMSKLRSMIDAGQLKVVIRNGRMLITLPNDVLFDSGKTQIKDEGKIALAQVAQVLATITDRQYIVAGHTDNKKIKTAKFPSNWELSTARAVEVTKFLVDNGMRPESLAAAGYGEYSPVVANDTPENLAQNRRIEIVLQPNIGDLPSLEGIEKENK